LALVRTVVSIERKASLYGACALWSRTRKNRNALAATSIGHRQWLSNRQTGLVFNISRVTPPKTHSRSRA